ncbi:hypothetical protein INT48_006695 [Thamnidium elegans]|uniref:catalase n=1 Tax=Thamnidium elegans TaxID=101142 RepID=A0A8H7VYA3_9FUNG|nr:hypothetical protein INT48_006695 [Thamnidium elegans]
MKSINLIILLDTLLRLCVFNPIDPVKEVIVVDAGTQETTQFGTKINNTDSLQAGERDWYNLTADKFLQDPDTKTPVFVRFSTVLDSKDAPGTVRDVRDAIKFPNLIHAVKPEPYRYIPQEGTAHCTTYEFFSQGTESVHTVMRALSGGGLVRSFRQVEGFGVHTQASSISDCFRTLEPTFLFENNFQGRKKYSVVIREKSFKLGQAIEEAILKQMFWIHSPIGLNATISPTSTVD